MAEILVIDDDKMVCDTMSRVIRDMGHNVKCVGSLEEGIREARSGDFDVVFLDVRLPDGNGLNKLPTFQTVKSLPEVIIITGYADSDGAELAVRNNAWDYIKKPASIDSVTLSLVRALQYREGKNAARPAVTLKREGIIGDSPRMSPCFDLLAQAANSDANVLITGETGTGKELFARAIHANSPRAQMRFVAVDCALLPESLMGSLLFGHTKGAFTGATRAEEGFLKHADGGTLLLDEIGDLPLSMQKGFLRVLQERRFYPIGGTLEAASDFRLIAATNRDLDEMVRLKKFRDDLLFRLRSIVINLPPLRERTQDIKELAANHVKFLCESWNVGIKGFSPDFFEVLTAYNWPGNVRELLSAIESATAQAHYEPTLFPKHLPGYIRIYSARASIDNGPIIQESEEESGGSSGYLPLWRDFRKSLIEQGEKKYLHDLLSRADRNIKNASKLSGLSQPRLYELLRKYEIST
ncbi:MAG: sigma-54 dependent transcriptional regulator [Thermodesulfobacteriota bacterium]|nr:sigma-54 dependent transcriptional regulator [Thermodesulfobacteriota bacterium]